MKTRTNLLKILFGQHFGYFFLIPMKVYGNRICYILSLGIIAAFWIQTEVSAANPPLGLGQN